MSTRLGAWALTAFSLNTRADYTRQVRTLLRMAKFRECDAATRRQYIIRAAREIGFAHEAEDIAQEAALLEIEKGRVAISSREAAIWGAREVFGEQRGQPNRVRSAPFVGCDPDWLAAQLPSNPERLWIEALDLEAELSRMPWLPAFVFIEAEIRGTSLAALAAGLRLSVGRVEHYLLLARHALCQALGEEWEAHSPNRHPARNQDR